MNCTLISERKKQNLCLDVVDRETRCVLSWDVVPERSSEALQACLERAPQARQYYSDAFPVYDTLYYGAPYELRLTNEETYTVEAVNADLRHYLKRLARQSRCFSRRMHSLIKTCAYLSIVTTTDNWKRLYPKYSFHLVDFVSLSI